MQQSNEMTAKEGFDELNPVLDRVMKLITSAPLSAIGRTALAVMVSSYFIGVLCAMLGLSREETQTKITAFLELMGIPKCSGDCQHVTKH